MLVSRTDPQWVDIATGDLDAVLLDHAHCEKKAAASAMSLVSGYPDREELVVRLTALAIEELSHFRAVYQRIAARGLTLGRDSGDPYAQRLLALARPMQGRLTDRLLLFGLIEARSQERLALLAEHVTEPELRAFYAELSLAEARHAELFRDLARLYDADDHVETRLEELAREEAAIVRELPIEARIH